MGFQSWEDNKMPSIFDVFYYDEITNHCGLFLSFFFFLYLGICWLLVGSSSERFRIHLI